MLTRIRHLLELIRFSHTIFALPFALLAALMAWRANAIYIQMSETLVRGMGQNLGLVVSKGVPEHVWRWQELVGILLSMVTGRSAAMSFNRLADRKIDAL